MSFAKHDLITSGNKTKDLSLEIIFFSHFSFGELRHLGGSVKETKLNAQSISMLSDGAFSTDIGLELLGATGPVCWIGSSCNLQPALKG